MKILFNEISARNAPIDLAATIESLIEDLDLVALTSWDRPTFYAGNYEEVATIFFEGEESLSEFAMRHPDAERRALLLIFLSSTNHLDDDPMHAHREMRSKEVVSYVRSYELISENCKAAISLRDKDAVIPWKLRFEELPNQTSAVEIPHVGSKHSSLNDCVAEFEEFLAPFVAAARANSSNKTPDLPKSMFSNILLEKINAFVDTATGADERTGRFFLVGGAVARLNGYKRAFAVEAKNATHNHLRKIFFSQELRKYLSIDFMHGAFEVCDAYGRHVREIDFFGLHLSDARADHSITV